MTTPSQNVHVTTLGNGTYETKAPSGPWETRSWYGPAVHLQVWERPESVNNPMRTDGSRAPSGFDTRWLLVNSPYVTYEARFSDNFEIRGTSPALLLNIPAEYMFLPGAAWATGDGIFPLSIDQRARTKLFNKVLKGEANFGESLGELRETMGLVSSLATRTGVAFQGICNAANMRKKDVSSLFKRLEGMSRKEATQRARDFAGRRGADAVSDWLGYQWGVKPLMSDIDSTSKELSRLVLRDRPTVGYREVIRGGAGLVEEEFDYLVEHTPVPWTRTRCQFGIQVGAHYSVTVGYPIPDAMRYEQLGLANPVSTAWNLMRFTQLVDYAVGVGSWLESLTPVMNGYENQQFIEGSLSRIQRSVLTGYDFELSFPGSFTKLVQKRGAWQGGRFERIVLSGWPVPAALPQLKKRIGLTQMANSLSALTVLVGGISRRPF